MRGLKLGAGNTGRAFDLETNLRIAEFKFARWQGGAETIRQNGVFKDFYLLAHSGSPKRKQLYLLGVDRALTFLTGRRAMSSVLSRGDKLKSLFEARFGDQFRTVGDYYAAHRHLVALEDASPWLSELAQGLLAEDVDVNTL